MGVVLAFPKVLKPFAGMFKKPELVVRAFYFLRTKLAQLVDHAQQLCNKSLFLIIF